MLHQQLKMIENYKLFNNQNKIIQDVTSAIENDRKL